MNTDIQRIMEAEKLFSIKSSKTKSPISRPEETAEDWECKRLG